MTSSRHNVKTLSGTPAQHGFHFPAEWERHVSTWFSWPRPEGISFPEKYHTVPANLAAIIREIVPREIVNINVPNENYRRIVTEQLIAGGVPRAAISKRRVRFHFIPTNEAWCRDHGPAFLVRRTKSGKRERAIVDWGFNAWGGKYPPFDADDAVPTRVAEALGRQVEGIFYPRHKRAGGAGGGVVMEGGSVDFNGRGTVLTTDACLLNKNRNPGLTKKELERFLKNYYGQTHTIWLGEGIVGDDTDGHIDDISRFIDPRTVVTAIEDDPRDQNYHLLKDNLRRLQLAHDQDGRPLRIIPIPMPGVVEHDGQRLPASYANFYFVNGAVLVPTYRNRRNDRRALEVLQEAIPKRRVIGIDCYELIWGLGSIHCLTQQEPA